MDENRKQFEEWIYQNRVRGLKMNLGKFDVDGRIYYVVTEIQSQWNAWQASRAAIEIELPGDKPLVDNYACGYNEAITQCANSIRAVGVNIKAP